MKLKCCKVKRIKKKRQTKPTQHVYTKWPISTRPEHKMDIDMFVSFVEQQFLGSMVIPMCEYKAEHATRLLHTITKNSSLKLQFVSTKDTRYITIEGVKIATGERPSGVQKPTRKKLSEDAVEELKSYCFVLYQKREPRLKARSGITITEDQLKTGSLVKPAKMAPAHLAEDKTNAGLRMMLKMGWSGGGLGSREQGNPDLIKVHRNIRRSGLGAENSLEDVENITGTKPKTPTVRKKKRHNAADADQVEAAEKILQDYAESDQTETLIFDVNFEKKTRKSIHEIALRLHLTTKSYGLEENRRITVSKKPILMEIVRQVLHCGGENDEYRVGIPKKYDDLLEM